MSELTEQRSHSYALRSISRDDLINRALNDDIMIIIFRYLPIEDQFISRRVCRRWNDNLNYILNLRNTFAMTLNEDEPNDGSVKCDCNCNKHAVHGNDCIALKCRTIKDGSRTLYIVTYQTLESVFNRCPNITTLSLMHTIFDRNVWEFFRDRCPNRLEHIDFSNSQGLIDEVLRFVANNCGPTLKHVTLYDSDISEQSVECLINNCPNLESFDMSKNVRVTGECFTQFTPNLKQLLLNDCLYVDLRAISALINGNGKSLQRLEIGDSLNEPMLSLICDNCNFLTHFEVDCSNITNEDVLKGIGKLSELKQLSIILSFDKYDSFLMRIMKGCRKLIKLSLDGAIFTDESLKYIGDFCPFIEELSISTGEVMRNKKITDLCCDSIAKLSKLKHLDLQSTNIGDGLIKVIRECKSLKTIEIDGCRKVNDTVFNQCIEIIKLRPCQRLTLFARDTRITIALHTDVPQHLELILT